MQITNADASIPNALVHSINATLRIGSVTPYIPNAISHNGIAEPYIKVVTIYINHVTQ